MHVEVPGPRLAVVVRAHLTSPAVLNLLAGLAGSSAYDLYVAVNETRGKVDFGPYPVIGHTLDDFSALGFPPPYEHFIVHCSDLLFSVIQRRIPFYTHYLLLEYDLSFTRPGRQFIERVVGLLSGEQAGVDLLGGGVVWRGTDWWWAAAAGRFFPKVYSVFYPFVLLSSRAVSCLFQARLDELSVNGFLEARPDARPDNMMHCEAITGSALAASGYEIKDLIDVIPGCYTTKNFRTGLPMLFGTPVDADPAEELLHPVLGAEQYLVRHLNYALETANGPAFLEHLRTLKGVVPDNVLWRFEERAKASLDIPAMA